LTIRFKVLLWGGFNGRFVLVCLFTLSLLVISACGSQQQSQISDISIDGNQIDQNGNGNESSEDGDFDDETENPQQNDIDTLINSTDDQSAQLFDNRQDVSIDSADPCRMAENDLGYLACRTNLANEGEYYQLSQSDEITSEIERIAKYLIPATTEAPLPGMIQNVNKFSLHYEFLKTVFPKFYAALTTDQYEDLVLNSDTRQYFAGALVKLTEKCKGAAFGFTVYQNTSESLMSKLEISYIQKAVSALMPGEDILYFPMSSAEENAVSSWGKSTDEVKVYDCGLPVDYEVYNSGSTYGYVRILTMSEFEEASYEGLLCWQDIIVLEGTPFNITSPSAAIVTGERQNVLSHINVQASVRGTPNIYVRNPFEAFAVHEGQLVRLDADESGYDITSGVSAEEAREWWEEHRPRLENVVVPDYSYTALPELDEVAVADRLQRSTAFSRFGGKGANLAILSSVIDHQFMVDGVLIPFYYFQDFMDNNSITLSSDPSSNEVSYTNYMKYWVNNDDFLLSATKRREVLERLVNDIVSASELDSGLVINIADRIQNVFGSENVMVRLRSSSNMEDSIEFSGAGLYESYSACAADSFGGNPAISKCDASKNRQMAIQSALRKVWASFWRPQAFEERFYFQYYNPVDTAMAIVVTQAFNNEAANGVVFTGLPNQPGDERMLVNAQAGETSVVSPPQGVLPETTILKFEGERTEVTRIQTSSLVSYPATVLSDAEYSQMAVVLDQIRRNYPIDADDYPEDSIILDLEFKYTPDHKLYFKQSRAFLIRTESANNDSNGFNFKIEPDTAMCGQFVDFREPLEEYALKTMVNLKQQQVILPVEGDINIELVDSIIFGPDQIKLEAVSSPQWERQSALQNGKMAYQFSYCNTFAGMGVEAEICWQTSGYELAGSFTPSLITIDEDQISNLRNNWNMALYIDGIENEIRLSSCTYANFPTYRRSAVLSNGQKITMDVRNYPTIIGSSNAALVSVQFEDGEVLYGDDNYFRLVYSAEHHNIHEKLMFVFDRPTSGLGGLIFEEPYADDPDPVRVFELDENLDILGSSEVTDYVVEIIP